MALSDQFSFNGRATRLDYWRTQMRLALGAAVFVFGAVFLTMAELPRWVPALALLPLLALLWISIAIVVRRLHDRNKPAWWIVVFQFGPWLLTAAPVWILSQAMTQVSEEDPVVLTVLLVTGLASIALSIWALVEIGFLRGTPGPNRFGPPN